MAENLLGIEEVINLLFQANTNAGVQAVADIVTGERLAGFLRGGGASRVGRLNRRSARSGSIFAAGPLGTAGEVFGFGSERSRGRQAGRSGEEKGKSLRGLRL
jgi:hypothetical protein